MTAISSNKKVCVKWSVLGLCSLHREVDNYTSSSVRLPSVIEPLEFVSSGAGLGVLTVLTPGNILTIGLSYPL